MSSESVYYNQTHFNWPNGETSRHAGPATDKQTQLKWVKLSLFSDHISNFWCELRLFPAWLFTTRWTIGLVDAMVSLLCCWLSIKILVLHWRSCQEKNFLEIWKKWSTSHRWLYWNLKIPKQGYRRKWPSKKERKEIFRQHISVTRIQTGFQAIPFCPIRFRSPVRFGRCDPTTESALVEKPSALCFCWDV